MNAKELHVKKDEEYVPSGLFYCGNCRVVHHSETGADTCCTGPKAADPKPCRYCGEMVTNEQGYTWCPDHHDECKIKDQMSKAEEVGEDGLVMFYDPHNERYETSTELIMDYFCDEEMEARPEFCFACKERRWPGIELERVLDDSLDDYCDEDGEHDDPVDEEELAIFLKKWNAKQNIKVYDPDFKKKVRLHWEKPE